MAGKYWSIENGRYYFRRRVPRDVAKLLGKSEIKIALGTSEKKVAKPAAYKLYVKSEEVIQAARLYLGNDNTEPTMSLSSEDIRRLAQQFSEALLNGDQRTRLATGEEADDEYTNQYNERVPDPSDEDFLIWRDVESSNSGDLRPGLAEARKNVVAALSRGNTKILDGAVDQFLTLFLRIRRGWSDEDDHRLKMQILKTVKSAFDNIIARDEGQIGPSDQLPNTLFDSAPAKFVSFEAVYLKWKGAKSGRGEKTEYDCEKAFDKFQQFVGHDNAAAVTRTDFLNYIEERQGTKSPRGGTIKGKTVRKFISMIGAAYQIAVDKKLLLANPAERIRIDFGDGGQKAYFPFERNEIATIFGSSAFMSGDRPHKCGGEAVYWLPLICYFTGARPEEIAELKPKQVKYEEGLCHYLDFVELDDDQSVKNLPSKRKIPIHPKLIELGFLEFVRQADPAKNWLFPDLEPDRFGCRYAKFGKFWTKYRRALGITSGKKVFYSFRHLFKSRSKDAEIGWDDSESMLGHKTATYGDEYIPLPRFWKLLGRIGFYELPLVPEWEKPFPMSPKPPRRKSGKTRARKKPGQ